MHILSQIELKAERVSIGTNMGRRGAFVVVALLARRAAGYLRATANSNQVSCLEPERWFSNAWLR